MVNKVRLKVNSISFSYIYIFNEIKRMGFSLSSGKYERTKNLINLILKSLKNLMKILKS